MRGIVARVKFFGGIKPLIILWDRPSHNLTAKGVPMTGKSKEEVAFDILSKLKGVGVWGENNREAILDLYAECLEATSGNRSSGNIH